MNPLTCLPLQLRLEGKRIVNEQWLRQVEVVPGEEIPLLLLAQLADKKVVTYYAEALSPDLQKELDAGLLEAAFPNVDALVNILQSRKIQIEVGHYKTYVIPAQTAKDLNVLRLSKHDPQVKAFGFDGFAQHVFTIEREGRIVSACVSARENEKCGEAWVYTDPAYRHQGFAQSVVRSWARSLMDRGKVPFYSHRIENTASANLAKKLALQPVFEEITLTQM